MSKQFWKPSTLLSPVPVVLVSCGSIEKPNLVTVGWTGIINTNPAMLYISLRPERYSHKIISETGEFAVNLVKSDMVKKVDQCGIYTGAKMDKFKKFLLTPSPATSLECPIVDESPINLECKVDRVIKLGTHDMFLAKIVGVDVDESLINADGKLDLRKSKLVAYSHGDYLELGRKIGSFGFSVKNKHKKK